MSVHLRAATEADLAGITDTFLACWRESYVSVLPAASIEAMTDARAAALWARVLADTAGGTVLVAVGDTGEIVGITRYGMQADGTGIVQSLYVSPRAQRLGLGARLLTAATAGLREAKAHTMTLWVFADNAPSIAFYRSQGWTPDGTTRVQDEFGAPELRLTHDRTEDDR